MSMPRLALGMALATATLAAVTVAALEGREVVVLRTFDGAGAPRDTRTWIADENGAAWIEAANPTRPFLRQLTASPAVELVRAGSVHRCQATAVANPEGHRRIRHLLAAKYGWADCWIGLLTDTSESVAVRLVCL
jgi:hypothetical protein